MESRVLNPFLIPLGLIFHILLEYYIFLRSLPLNIVRKLLRSRRYKLVNGNIKWAKRLPSIAFLLVAVCVLSHAYPPCSPEFRTRMKDANQMPGFPGSMQATRENVTESLHYWFDGEANDRTKERGG
ncbi:hypothetical protein M434DRAFT_15378 [Hypoxylon sp. CO27-5]|nr:hypothetical protein M434DRAFT_15378 [Hypoxylon sp. CO27-5]